jgi:hypothetical protein
MKPRKAAPANHVSTSRITATTRKTGTEPKLRGVSKWTDLPAVKAVEYKMKEVPLDKRYKRKYTRYGKNIATYDDGTHKKKKRRGGGVSTDLALGAIGALVSILAKSTPPT